MDSTLAALLGAIIGGVLSVVASWLAQRVQSRSQWLAQEIARRQQLYSEFIDAAVCCYADALEHDEVDSNAVAKLYGEMGRMRVSSSQAVVREANRIVHRILKTYADTNRSRAEIRDLLSEDSVDFYSEFADACRAELMLLQPDREPGLRFRPISEAGPPS